MLRSLLVAFLLQVYIQQQRVAGESVVESDDLDDRKDGKGCFAYGKIFDGPMIGPVRHAKDASKCQKQCQNKNGCEFFRFRNQYDETDEHNGRNKCFLLSKKTGENGNLNWISGPKECQ